MDQISGMDDQGLNKYLSENYGHLDGQVLFRLIWSTNVTENRRGTFIDMYDNQFIRQVTEVRECLKYPMAQDRWILETIIPTPESVYNQELFSKYTYEGIYIFQDKEQEFLPLSRDMLDAAMYLYLVWHRMEYKDRLDLRLQQLAEKDKAKKEKIRQIIGEELRSPLFTVLESTAALGRKR